MGTITVNISNELEEKFRASVKRRIGEGKGKLGSAVKEAFSKWIAEDEYQKLMKEAVETLKKGLYKLPKGYKFRRAEAYEKRYRKITGSS